MVERPGIPARFWGASPSKINFSEEQKKLINTWAKNPSGNLLFYGEPGRGKTYAAIACMYFLESCKIPWHDQRFIEIPMFYQQWLGNILHYDENLSNLYKLKEIKVLVLDDIGVKKPSESFLDYLHTLINARCNNQDLITIYTTNLSAIEFNEMLGPRIISRISDGVKIEFKGPDLRRK